MTDHLLRRARPLGGDPVDLLLQDGVIAQVGPDLDAGGATVVDADFDVHVQKIAAEPSSHGAGQPVQPFSTSGAHGNGVGIAV